MSRSAPPSIISVSPASGPQSGGTRVIILGQNFVDGCRARFGGSETDTVFNGSTQLFVVTPGHNTPGFVDVQIINPDGQSGVLPNGFLYGQAQAPPLISSLSPTSGPV